MIPLPERLTESEKINAIRERLQGECSQGRLGIVAARARVPEYQLYDWCKEPSKVPTYGELVDIEQAMGMDLLTRDEHQQSE